MGWTHPSRWSISSYLHSAGVSRRQVCKLLSSYVHNRDLFFFFTMIYCRSINWKTFSKSFRIFKNYKIPRIIPGIITAPAVPFVLKVHSQTATPLNTLFFERTIFFLSFFFDPVSLSIETLLFFFFSTRVNVPVQNCRGPVENFYGRLFNDIVARYIHKARIHSEQRMCDIDIKIGSLLNKTIRLKIRNQFNRFSKPPSRWISRRGDKTIRFDSALLLLYRLCY